MLKIRVIPVLLLRGGGLVKGNNFKDHKYVGDPINAVKIFNDKEVDELVFLDIGATASGKGPNFDLLKDIVSEAFVPLAYGGGVSTLEQLKKLFNIGIEKVIFNSSAFTNPQIIYQASQVAGSQSIVVSIDVKKNFWGTYQVFIYNGTKSTKKCPVEYAKEAEALGAGELIVTSIDREGTGIGYDNDLLKSITSQVTIPVTALGGAANLEHLKETVDIANVSGTAAGDMFIFTGKHKAVLITYPEYSLLEALFQKD